jgi:hypothetical protein
MPNTNKINCTIFLKVALVNESDILLPLAQMADFS